MTNKTKTTIIKILYVIIVILFVAFIFSNSLESREVSASKSGRILDKVNEVLERINFPLLMKDSFIRKTAHFVEFFILGFLLAGYWGISKSVCVSRSVYMCFAACLIAMTDETIQYFSQRGSMLLDVWLDLSASSLAVLIFYLIYTKNK